MLGFNSTLVQLKDSLDIQIKRTQKRFNSTLVQLKAGFLIIILSHLTRFNSTLVQLKAKAFTRKAKYNWVSILP